MSILAALPHRNRKIDKKNKFAARVRLTRVKSCIEKSGGSRVMNSCQFQG